MTEAEQAALYEAGVKASYPEDKEDPTDTLAYGTAVHMALEEGMEGGVPIMRGSSDLHLFPTLISSADWFGPEVTVQGYAATDAEWTMSLFERWNKAKRLAAQRPLIHNGRKMKR